jgi:hypothetical protein
MDHTEARALMADHFAAPTGRATDVADQRALAEMEAHVAGCPDCAAEYRSLRATAAALQLVLGPPRGARARVLDNVAQLGRQRDAGTVSVSRRGWWPMTLPRALAVAAVVALLAFIAGALGGALLPRPDDSTQLARAAQMMAELAREPTAHTMVLRDASGTPGGTVIYEPASAQLVVFSEMLEPPVSGRYGCYVERAGERSWIGPMLFEADTAFWAGHVSGMSDLGQAGDRFLVLRDASDATPMLSASF